MPTPSLPAPTPTTTRWPAPRALATALSTAALSTTLLLGACTDPGDFVGVHDAVDMSADMPDMADMAEALPLDRSCNIDLDCEVDGSFHVTVRECKPLSKKCDYACAAGYEALPNSERFKEVGCPCITTAHPCHQEGTCDALTLHASCSATSAGDMGADDMSTADMGADAGE